jgi:diaminopimelate decarboxylase
VLNESFHYENNQLWCDQVPLADITAKTGTPVYLYSAARLRSNVRRLQEAFDPLGASIHYSLKANANLTLLQVIQEAGLGADAVSAGEIDRALRTGFDPAEIVFAGVGKSAEELAFALDRNIGWFNVESQSELDLLDRLAGIQGKIVRVALRLNPGIQAQTHSHIATGHGGAKFGIPTDGIATILAQRTKYSHVRIDGLHIHIGSQLGSVEETVAAVRVAQDLAGSDIRTLNIGGGFPVAYTETDHYPSPAAFAAVLAPLLAGWTVMIEPGRSIIADAGILVVEVLRVKEQGEHCFAITNGGMTDLIRPALYDAVHPVVPLRLRSKPEQLTIVTGPICESTDVLHRGAWLPSLETGDQLAVLVAGAYGMVMASNYNQRTRPPEALVEGDQWRLIRRRETWEDLLRLELPG